MGENALEVRRALGIFEWLIQGNTPEVEWLADEILEEW